MARMSVEDEIAYDRETVFKTFRDDLIELLQYLPDIQDIEVKGREQVDEDTVKIHNLWQASQDEVPTLAKKFIKPEMLKWNDYATWHEDTWVCEWEMEVGFLQDAIECTGETRYIDAGDERTKIVIDGDLKVDAKQIPGVPRLVASKVGNTVENFVVKLIQPNLTDVNRGIEKYLAARES